MLGRLLLPVLLALAPLGGSVRAQSSPAYPGASIFPEGTVVPVRFLERVAGGRDTVGHPVVVQTLAALVAGGCIAVPAYTELSGSLIDSKRGGWFGRSGELGLRFDSLRVGPDWVGVTARLDSLEYAAPGTISDSGMVSGHRHSLGHRGANLAPLALAGASPVTVVPAAMFAGWSLARRGPRASILAGESGVIRLSLPLTLANPVPCRRAEDAPALAAPPALPHFIPHTDDHSGRHPGDPINLILLGTAETIDSAFARAAWLVPAAHSRRRVVSEVAAALMNKSSLQAPVSTQYFDHRPQDLSYERPGPTVRVRHHVRFWVLDSALAVWVGAANQDIGLKLQPGSLSATHRISPDVDLERDLIVRELESTGCADLVTFDSLPGSVAGGRNAAGQSYVTDRRAAIIRFHTCPVH